MALSTVSRLQRLALVVGFGLLCVGQVLVGAVSCSDGSSPTMKAEELVGAEITMLMFYLPGSDEPYKYSIDLDDWLVERLILSYESMAPWSGDEEDLLSPDVQFTIYLTGDRRTVLSQARITHDFVLVEQYDGGELVDSFYMRPMLMHDFIGQFVTRTPGGG